MVRLTINGKPEEVDNGSTLADFLKKNQTASEAVVVELNGAILPKGKYDNVRLNEGDRLEIVQIIGGG